MLFRSQAVRSVVYRQFVICDSVDGKTAFCYSVPISATNGSEIWFFRRSCFEYAEKYGNAVAAVPVKDSLRINSGTKTKAVDRNDFFSIQTPQIFPCATMKKAYQQTFQPFFTDDATVVEAFGFDINLMQGRELNLKITTAEDLLLAEYIYSLESKEFV